MIKVHTRNEQYRGGVSSLHGWPILWVWYGEQADVEHHKYTACYDQINERPWVVARTRRSYKTLESALHAYNLLTPLETA